LADGLSRDGDFVGVYRVDEVGLNGGEFFLGDLAFENDDASGGDEGAVFSGENLDALGGGVGALVELAGEEFDGEGGFVCGEGEFVGSGFDLGLGENELGGLGELIG